MHACAVLPSHFKQLTKPLSEAEVQKSAILPTISASTWRVSHSRVMLFRPPSVFTVHCIMEYRQHIFKTPRPITSCLTITAQCNIAWCAGVKVSQTLAVPSLRSSQWDIAQQLSPATGVQRPTGADRVTHYDVPSFHLQPIAFADCVYSCARTCWLRLHSQTHTCVCI